MATIDLLLATQDALFDAINVPAVTALAPVFTNVPADQQPPFAAIGAIDAENVGPKDGGLEKMTVEVEYQFRGSTRRPLLGLMHAVRTALEDADLIYPGAALETPRWLATATDREDDGVTYHGIQRFELHAQPDE